MPCLLISQAMLRSLVKNLVRGRGPAREAGKPVPPPTPSTPVTPLRLHIGGQVAHPDWKILDIEPREHCDYVGSCTDLSQFPDGSVLEIYASHVLEHLGYQHDLPAAVREFHRVLTPGGLLRASVPDLTTLCSLFMDASLSADERSHVMRLMFGGQVAPSDFHRVGLYDELLARFLRAAGFTDIKRVHDLELFDDMSRVVFMDRAISLNMIALKPRHDDTIDTAAQPKA